MARAAPRRPKPSPRHLGALRARRRRAGDGRRRCERTSTAGARARLRARFRRIRPSRDRGNPWRASARYGRGRCSERQDREQRVEQRVADLLHDRPRRIADEGRSRVAPDQRAREGRGDVDRATAGLGRVHAFVVGTEHDERRRARDRLADGRVVGLGGPACGSPRRRRQTISPSRKRRTPRVGGRWAGRRSRRSPRRRSPA